MKIRTGFITNSSSTNFLIISKDELTDEYLFDKFGFIRGGALESQGKSLCASIMAATQRGIRHYNYEKISYDAIKEVFGDKAAKIYKSREGHYAIWGYTDSDDEPIVQFFTTDSFEINEDDFYVNGRSCVW